MNPDAVQVYVTGGTFDKEYNFLTGDFFFKDTHLIDMFKKGRCTVDLDIKTLMMVDSLEMTEADREIIAYNCKNCKHENILITHGTDTMVETAIYLSNHGLDNKTIILTGAIIPTAFGTSSDGYFNLGSSLAFAQALNPGIYIVMNGRVFDWDDVKKNRSTGFFEYIK